MAPSTGYTRWRAVSDPVGRAGPRPRRLPARPRRPHAAMRFSDRMRSLGLRPKHFAVLNAAALADGASQQELGGRMRLDPSGLGRADHGLERKGPVERRRDPADPRREPIAPTAKGAATARRPPA